MRNTQVAFEQFILNINHNSDWSGDVHFMLFKTAETHQTSFYKAAIPPGAVPFVDVEIPGKLIVGLAVNLVRNAATSYVEDLISGLCVEGGILSRMIQR